MRQWHPAGVVRRDDGRALSGPYRYRRSICTIPDERIPDVQKRTRDTMKRKIGAAMLAGASTFAAAGADAEEQKRFTWEGTLEIGVDAVVKSDTPGADVSDTYLTLDVWGEFALAERVVLVGDGRVVADGTHAELLATSAEYRQVLAAAEASAERARHEASTGAGATGEEVRS